MMTRAIHIGCLMAVTALNILTVLVCVEVRILTPWVLVPAIGLVFSGISIGIYIYESRERKR